MLTNTIVWTKDKPQADYTARTGVDAENNIYHMAANLETVTCTTHDGFYGCGFTATEARLNAAEQRSKWAKANR